MKNTNQLANRFREVLLSGKWIANTNFKDQLSKVSYEQAIHEVQSLNTIYALTFHVNYYIEGVLNVFEGGLLEIRDKYSFDYSEITSKQSWNKLRDKLSVNAEIFANHIELMSEEKLAEIFVDKKYGTYQRNIEAIIEHSYYHLGQISLIKKLIK